MFFQSQWHLVGQDLVNLMQGFFRSHESIAKINETFVFLIPNIERANRLKDFHPIGLCNVFYKSVTKILAIILCGLMEKLVDPCQVSFITNWQSGDNIIITKKIFHSMINKRGQKGWMAIKVCLEKSYDHLKWELLQETLTDIGCPKNFVHMIWCCISFAKMHMLLNGEVLDEFIPRRGFIKAT